MSMERPTVELSEAFMPVNPKALPKEELIRRFRMLNIVAAEVALYHPEGANADDFIFACDVADEFGRELIDRNKHNK